VCIRLLDLIVSNSEFEHQKIVMRKKEKITQPRNSETMKQEKNNEYGSVLGGRPLDTNSSD